MGIIAEREDTCFQHPFDNSPGSVRQPYSCILSFSNFLRISRRAPIFSSTRRLLWGQSPNIHTNYGASVVKRSQKSPESPLFRLDPFFLMSCTLQILILERSEFVRGGLRCGGEFYDCVKRGLNGGSRVVRPSKSFIQSPTL